VIVSQIDAVIEKALLFLKKKLTKAMPFVVKDQDIYTLIYLFLLLQSFCMHESQNLLPPYNNPNHQKSQQSNHHHQNFGIVINQIYPGCVFSRGFSY